MEYGAPGVFPLPMGKEGRMDMRGWVYRLGRGPRQHIGVEFEVSQAARMAKSQVNNGVL